MRAEVVRVVGFEAFEDSFRAVDYRAEALQVGRLNAIRSVGRAPLLGGRRRFRRSTLLRPSSSN